MVVRDSTFAVSSSANLAALCTKVPIADSPSSAGRLVSGLPALPSWPPRPPKPPIPPIPPAPPKPPIPPAPPKPLAPPKPPLAAWQQPYPMPAIPPWAQRTFPPNRGQNGTPPYRRGVHPVRIAATVLISMWIIAAIVGTAFHFQFFLLLFFVPFLLARGGRRRFR